MDVSHLGLPPSPLRQRGAPADYRNGHRGLDTRVRGAPNHDHSCAPDPKQVTKRRHYNMLRK